MKFLADGMLGKFSRWLRILGHDVIYSTQLCDKELLELAKTKERVLLTRDFELYKRAIGRGLESFYVQGKRESDQLGEVAGRYGISLFVNMNESHCPLCNAKIQQVSKEQLKDDLEENTYHYYDKFWRCPNCEQIYWQGAHWKHITETLTRAQKNSFFN